MKKILLIRFSSIGDIILTTPVIRALKQQLQAEIHFLCKRSFKPVLAANPYIDCLHLIDKKVNEVLPDLKQEQFDFIIDLHNNIRSRQIKSALKSTSYTFNKINFAKWLIVNLKINRLPNIHIVDRYMQTVLPLGVENDGKGLDYFIPEVAEIDLPSYFATNFPKNTKADLKYVAFVIGAAHQTKRLPTTKIISICRHIQLPVILLGGPGEAEEGAQIADAAGSHVHNSCGQLKLNQSASLVQQAHLVITHDTGLMHMAAAFGKKIYSIWGNTIPEFGMYPYYPEGINQNTTFEVKGLSCRPCSKIGYSKCPKGHFKCMQEIDEEQLTQQIESL